MKDHLASRYVQRIQEVGGTIGWDYMGAAEFEWGAVPASLAVLRHEEIEEMVVPDAIFRDGGTMTAVVPKWYADKALQSIHDTILASYGKLDHCFKETTQMDCLLSLGEVRPREARYKIHTTAWLSVDPFVSSMFKKDEDWEAVAREHVIKMAEEEEWPKYVWLLCRTVDLERMKRRLSL